jgi:hypothetical protein
VRRGVAGEGGGGWWWWVAAVPLTVSVMSAVHLGRVEN